MIATQGSRRSFLKRAAILGFIISTAPLARAHAKILRSEPKAGAQLTTPPTVLELWFNELLDVEFNKIELYSSKELTEKARTNLLKAKPVVDSDDRTHLRVPLPQLGPDTYAVEYRVLSRDGHSAPGRFLFTVLGR